MNVFPQSRDPDSGGLADAASLWAAEAGAASAVTLIEFRLDQNEKLAIPFTTSILPVQVHYLDFTSFRGYVRCPGADCLLCRVGRKVEKRDILPLYDVMNRVVVVLAVPENMRPQALKPQLAPVMGKVKNGERLLLRLSKLDSYRFLVIPEPLHESAEDGADAIANFFDKLTSGAVRLSDVYPCLDNETVAAFPEVAAALKARGIRL